MIRMSFKILRHYAPLRQIIAKGHLPLLRWAHQHRSFSPRLSSYDAHGYSSSSRVTPAATLPTDEIPRLQAQLDLLQSVLSKEFSDWTRLELQMYQTPAKLSEKIERIEETLLIARRTDAIFAQEKAAERVALVQTKAALAQEKAALAQTKAALVQTKAALAQEKSARDERLALKEKNVPEIKTLENLKLIPGLTFKDTPGFPVLTPDVFETSVDRDREFKAIYKFLLDREPLFGNSKKSDLRNFNKIMCIVGAPGTGKSHVLDYLEKKLGSIELDCLSVEENKYYSMVKEMLHDSAFIRVTLNTDTVYSPDENSNYVLSSRILFMYFIERMTFDKFNETCRCTLENAIDIVLKHARKKHAFLIVDEVNRLALTQSAHSPFQEVMAKIGQLIDGNQEPRINFVCSSLASIPLIDYETFSGRKYQEYALKQLVSVHKLFKGKSLTESGKALVKIAGGHSRTLENVHWALEENATENDLPNLLNLLKDRQKTSILDLEIMKRLLRSAITGTPVGRRQTLLNYGSVVRTTDESRAHGACSFLHVIEEPDKVIPAITPYQLVHYFRSLNQVLGNQFRDSFCSRKDQSSFGGIRFEMFHSSFECFRRMLWTDASLNCVKTASIQELYQTEETLFSKDFQNTSIRLPATYVLKEALSQTFREYVESGASLYGPLQNNEQKENAVIMRFIDTNPGFDALIITPMADQKGLHFTFIETRFSEERVRKQEPLFHIRRKHTLIVNDAVSCLRDALCRDNHGECVEYEWNFVYALYREHQDLGQDKGAGLPSNTVLLNRQALNHFYGPSLSGLGMFLKDKRSPEDLVQELD